MSAPSKEPPVDWPAEALDHWFDEDDECPECHGEGVVYSCHSDYACIDPEGGCDLCEQRCDFCRPRPAGGRGE